MAFSAPRASQSPPLARPLGKRTFIQLGRCPNNIPKGRAWKRLPPKLNGNTSRPP